MLEPYHIHSLNSAVSVHVTGVYSFKEDETWDSDMKFMGVSKLFMLKRNYTLMPYLRKSKSMKAFHDWQNLNI